MQADANILRADLSVLVEVNEEAHPLVSFMSDVETAIDPRGCANLLIEKAIL